MKILIKFFSIIGLLSMSQVAVAIDNVSDGDVLTADTMNEIIDATNANSGSSGLDFDIDNPCGGGTVYSVGDAGGDGGTVFFVTADGCNGLEAAPVDLAPASRNWGCDGENVSGADGTAIGDGAPNTLAVVNQACADPADAVDAARAYTGGAETDWYLPSKDELLEMYNTIGPGGDNSGGFVSNGVYWSSSEIDSLEVYVVNFANGGSPVNPKNFARESRAIRTLVDP